jgi:2-dehydropantoate 2-reductase
MKVLVFGAGVIGTLYAARLQAAGHEVTVLARGTRLAEIQQHGLVVEDIGTSIRSSARVATVDRLDAEDRYDMALITVRNDQLRAIMPALASNKSLPIVLFMLNNPLGSAQLVDALGLDRVLLGFPGAGGALEDHVVRYTLIRQQPTTIGEPRGIHTARPKVLADSMRAAGFPAQIDSDMDGWLMSHAFFVTSVCAAIYLAGGDSKRLSRSQPALELMVGGVREGFKTVRALGYAVHPFPLKVLFTYLPRTVAVYYWRRFFSQKMAEFIFAQHARHAVAEMRTLAEECRLLLGRSGIEGRALHQLYQAIDEYAAIHQPAGEQAGISTAAGTEGAG